MSKYDFSAAQRYAVYKAFKGICQWCGQFVDYSTFHVDHVLPESLLNDPPKMARIKVSYGLDDSFNINDYENWAPLHSNCNQVKSASVWEGIGLIRTILDNCKKNEELAHRIEVKINADVRKSDFLARMQTALDANLVNIQQLQNLMFKTDIIAEFNV